jgi:hypothetical protein
LEDGELEGAALQWTSNIDGTLGEGGQILVDLSEGQHTIVLIATDSNGDISTASVDVFVTIRIINSSIYLPLILNGS